MTHAVSARRTLASTTPSLRLSNIAELRLFFAVCVLVSHTIQLGGFTRYDIWRVILSSEVAVQGFFILSGYLVLGSYERSASLGDFYVRRFLRIYPAYAVAVLVMLGLGLLQTVVMDRPVAKEDIPRYLIANLSLLNFIQPGVAGVFSDRAYTEINGALWTIKLEMMFYALVPMVHAAGRHFGFRIVGAALMLLGLLWKPVLEMLSETNLLRIHPALMHQLPGQLHFFAIGILMFDAMRTPARARGHAATVAMATMLAALLHGGSLALQIALLCLFIFAVTRLRQAPTPFSRHDLSYGVYLCHFPIIQLLATAGFTVWGAGLFLMAVLGLATVYAALSWRWVEAPALRLAGKAAA